MWPLLTENLDKFFNFSKITFPICDGRQYLFQDAGCNDKGPSTTGVTGSGEPAVNLAGSSAAKVDRCSIVEGAPFSHEDGGRRGVDTHSCWTQVN